MKFRISGKAENLFGDGLALWFVEEPYYLEGHLHGFKDKFIGVGIIFDTYKNPDNIAAHRDISVITNDGNMLLSQMEAQMQGCNVNYRYHVEL